PRREVDARHESDAQRATEDARLLEADTERLGAETALRKEHSQESLAEAHQMIARARRAISTSVERTAAAFPSESDPATTAPAADRPRSPHSCPLNEDAERSRPSAPCSLDPTLPMTSAWSEASHHTFVVVQKGGGWKSASVLLRVYSRWIEEAPPAAPEPPAFLTPTDADSRRARTQVPRKC